MSESKTEIQFTPLTQSHFELLLRWFNEPHVQAFYSLRSWKFEEVVKKMVPHIQNEKGLRSFIVHFNNRPIAYIQSYPVKDHPWEGGEIKESVAQDAAGIDLLIGEEGYIGKGYGKQIIDTFLEKEVWPVYRYCFVDPDIRNSASIRLFEKCGFVEHKNIESQNALKQNITLKLMVKEKE